MEKEKKEKAITLIALVITIIVLMIITGVVVSFLTGDNSIINRAKGAINDNNEAKAKEILALAVNAAKIESETKEVTRADIRDILEFEVERNAEDDADVTTIDDAFLTEFWGYCFEVADDFSYINIVKPFNAAEWDQDATSEGEFLWASENSSDGELYHTIVGYRETLTNYTIVRIPSRCHVMDLQFTSMGNSNRMASGGNINAQISRTFNESFGSGRSRDTLGGVTKIEIPETVTKLRGAFFEFASVEEVVLSRNLTEITGASFYGCTNLKKVTIPSNVTKIGSYCFYNCSNLEEISVPNSVKSIGQYAFWGTKWFDNLNNGEVYLGKVFYLYKGDSPTTYKVKDGTVAIAARAFSTIKKESWGGYNNYENHNLTTVELPDSLVEIGEYAFGKCKVLTNISLPSSLKRIEDVAFFDCNSLKNISLPANMEYIGDKAFAIFSTYNTGIEQITTNGSIAKIGQGVFDNTTWYNNQPNGAIYIENILYRYKSTGNSNVTVEVKNGTTSISASAFGGISEISKVVLPNSLKEIGSSAFANCSNLKEVTINNNIVEIGSSAFYNDRLLEISSIPSSIKIIRENVFYNCKNLPENLVIPSSVTYIGSNAFYDTNIKTVNIPSSVKMIAQAAFYNCTKLQEVSISEGLQILTDAAFENCFSLNNAKLPASISFYGEDLFNNCINLAIVKVNKKRENTSLEKDLERACPETTLILYQGEDQEVYTITNNNDKVIVVSQAYGNQLVTINSVTEEKVVARFKLNGEVIEGNQFIMPTTNVVITDVEFSDQVVIEKVFENEMITGEYEGGFEENTAIKVEFDMDSVKQGTWLQIFMYDRNGNFIKEYSNTELMGKTIYLNDNGVKFILKNGEQVANYKFKCTINKTDELAYKGTETPYPYKPNSEYAFVTELNDAEQVKVTFSEDSLLSENDYLRFYRCMKSPYDENELWWSEIKYIKGSDISSKQTILSSNVVTMVLSSRNGNIDNTNGLKYSIEKYTPQEGIFESEHYYFEFEEGVDWKEYTYTYSMPGANMMKLQFDNETRFEGLRIYYGENDEFYGEYWGEDLSGKTIFIPANKVKMILNNYLGSPQYGFRCSVEATGNLESVGEEIIIESPHTHIGENGEEEEGYENNAYYEYEAEITEEADGIMLTFDEQSILESGCDRIYINDAETGKELLYITGYEIGGKTYYIPNTKRINIIMETDGSVVYWGFKCAVTGYKEQ